MMRLFGLCLGMIGAMLAAAYGADVAYLHDLKTLTGALALVATMSLIGAISTGRYWMICFVDDRQ